MENSTVQLGSIVARPIVAQQASPSQNRVRSGTAQLADEVDVQSAFAPRRRAWGVRDGELAAGSPTAEVHQGDYAEHEHLQHENRVHKVHEVCRCIHQSK
jgi:hypothetical protein